MTTIEKKASILLGLFSLFFALTSSQINNQCFVYFKTQHISFDMRELSSLKVGSLPITLIIDDTRTTGTIEFDFCHPLVLRGKCEENFKNSHVLFQNDKKTLCINLFSSHSSQNNYQFLNKNSLQDMINGFKVVKGKPDFTLEFICAKDATTPEILVEKNSLLVRSKLACGNVNLRAKLINKFRIPISVFMFIMGFAIVLFGKLKKPIFAPQIVGMIAFYASAYIFSVCFSSPPTLAISIGLFSISCMIGLIFHRINIKNPVILNAIIGFAVGCMIGEEALMLLEIKAANVILLDSS